jgi:hypothetical protein
MPEVGDNGTVLNDQYLPQGSMEAGDNGIMITYNGKSRVFSGSASVGDSAKMISYQGRNYLISSGTGPVPKYLWYFYSEDDPTGSMSWMKTRLASNLTDGYCFPKVCTDSDNNPHVIWSEEDDTSFWHAWMSEGGWNKEKIDLSGSLEMWMRSPHSNDLCISSDDRIHLALTMNAVGTNNQRGVYITKNPAGGWEGQTTLFTHDELGGGSTPYPRIYIDYDGSDVPHVIDQGHLISGNPTHSWYDGSWNSETLTISGLEGCRGLAVAKESALIQIISTYVRSGSYYYLRWWQKNVTWSRLGSDVTEYIYQDDLSRMAIDFGYSNTVRRSVSGSLNGIWTVPAGSGAGVVTYNTGGVPEAINYADTLDVPFIKNGSGDWKHYSARVAGNVYYNYLNIGTLAYNSELLISDGSHQHFDIDGAGHHHFVMLSDSASY